MRSSFAWRSAARKDLEVKDAAFEKQIAARDPEPLAPVLLVTATPLPPAEPAAANAAKKAGVVDSVRDWIVNVSLAPARALAPRLFGDPPTPPLPVPSAAHSSRTRTDAPLRVSDDRIQ